MEIFGILFSVPVVFVLILGYGALLCRVVATHDRFSQFFRIASGVILGFLAIEVVLLASKGPIRCRQIFGVGFEVVHLILFFLATPSLATLLILRGRSRPPGSRFAAAAACALFALLHVLLQYGVSEALHGVDGSEQLYGWWPGP